MNAGHQSPVSGAAERDHLLWSFVTDSTYHSAYKRYEGRSSQDGNYDERQVRGSQGLAKGILQLTLLVYKETQCFPRHEMYGLTN